MPALTDAPISPPTSQPTSQSKTSGIAVLTLGETMASFTQTRPGVMRSGSGFDFRIGGAESNVAIGLARLGVPTGWIGRVGQDPAGEEIIRALRGEGVEVLVGRDADRPTGLMVRDRRTAEHARVTYYRANSAGSGLHPDDLDDHWPDRPQVLHTTGITMAISTSAAATVERAIELAHDAGALVSFDVNFRSRLWTAAACREQLARLLPRLDLLFAGEDEAAILLGEEAPAPPEELIRLAGRLQDAGPAEVVIKRGPFGALAVEGEREASEPAVAVPVLDPVGAGDAFVAGYLAARLQGEPLSGRLRLGCATGAMACASEGDWEGAATRADLELIRRADPVSR